MLQILVCVRVVERKRERVREGDLHLHKFWAQYAAKYALFLHRMQQ